ncbi:MAG: protein translocase subunit SecDF [Chitinophagaceae bacterium]|nr:protein translocase subunit SecDF [Chitinophagaceae bacterium]
MRSLVTIFVGLLIVYSLYLLSFTWFVNSHEKSVEGKAEKFVKSRYPQTAQQKYPNDKEAQVLYQDTLERLLKQRRQQLLDSSKNQPITWWGTSYQKAKESELLLGLDLQGGINVTMDIELSGLIKGLANNPADPSLKKAIDEATRRKTNSDVDYITLFSQSFKDVNPNTPLAPLFASSTKNKLKIDASDNTVITYIREQANASMKQTYNVLTKRIDKFGVAQPNINLDENKGIITVELAGADDPERVRKYLQSTANLQFFAVYNIAELDKSIAEADKALAIVLNGSAPVDTAVTKAADSSAVVAPAADSPAIKSLKDLVNTTIKEKAKTTDSVAAKNEHPLIGGIIQFIPPQDNNKDGTPDFSAALGYVALKDTGTVNSYLQNPAVLNNIPADARFVYGMPEKDRNGKLQEFIPMYAIKTIPGSEKAELEGDHVIDAAQDFDQFGKVSVSMTMDKQGERIWERMTEANIGRPIAIVLDEIVYSAPNVMSKISGGSSQISGNFTVQEGQDLQNILKAGKLQAPAKIVQEQVVGPTLGQEAVKGGSMAFIIAFLLIFILMLVYYNTGGWVANIALILNLLLTVGVLAAGNATLTAAGIAGLVLTIGMAVDTNVIIFERIKEELTRGKNYQQAVKDGYKRSLAPVLDAHIATLMTACILFYFGLGPVLGFATTQIIGILLSLLCGIVISRLITDFWTNKNRHFNYFTPVSKRIFRHASFDFVKYRKVAYGISVVVLLLGIGAMFNGFKEGVEFSGGRSYIVNFTKPVDVAKVRDELNTVFGSSPVIKTYGSSSKLDITTDYLIAQSGENADGQVREKLYLGLKSFLPSGTTATDFQSRHIEQSKRVDATISDDLKSGAKWATFWSLLLITLYILIRFRDWRYSLGTVFSLLHDVVVTIIVFSFLKDIVPFPLEIDQHFIAAILTVIGFSMNDTVIVFDRIREYTGTMKGASKAEIINKAINDTLSRTIMTSLTVFLTILILFLVGGEVTKGFAFAMLIGVVTGTYSSIFVAAPVLLEFGKNRALGSSSEEPVVKTTVKTAPQIAPVK